LGNVLGHHRLEAALETPRQLELLGAFRAAEEVLLETGLLVRRQRTLVVALE
jgi:hypothetical protein